MKRREQLNQLKDMSLDELKEQADSLRESLFRLKFRKTLGVGESASNIANEKKTLARVYTAIRQRESEAK
jgi:large subunit ribosomal protein L29